MNNQPNNDLTTGNMRGGVSATNQRLAQDIQNLAPMAKQYHQVTYSGAYMNYVDKSSNADLILPKFWGKVKSIGGEIGSIIGDGAKWVGNQVLSGVTGALGSAIAPFEALDAMSRANHLSQQVAQLNSEQDDLISRYKTGAITNSEYKAGLTNILDQQKATQSTLREFAAQNDQTKGQVIKDYIDGASFLLTIGTLGVAAPELAATSKAIDGVLDSAVGVGRITEALKTYTTSASAWKELPVSVQNSLKTSLATTINFMPKNATSAQIAKSVASRILIKYPLTYSALSSQANEIYDELDNAKYGDLVRTVAFNASMLLSGGIIGWGLKNSKRLLKTASIKAGLSSDSLLEELSAKIGNGDRLALTRAVQKKVKEGDKQTVESLIVALDTNLVRTGGNVTQAAQNILSHLSEYRFWGDLRQNMTHEQFLDNITKYFKSSIILDEAKRAGKFKEIDPNGNVSVVPGDWNNEIKNNIATELTKDSSGLGVEGTVESRLARLDEMIDENPQVVAFNNPNIVSHIRGIIKARPVAEDLHSQIMKIHTQVGLKGVPQGIAKRLAKNGHIAIIPRKHNLPVVPFEQTSKKIVASAEGDYFVKTAQPVAVLNDIGTFLNWAGLSPEESVTRVQDVFKTNFATIFAELPDLETSGLKVLGDTTEEAANDIVRKLWNYMKKPAGRLSFIPITDMRMMTTKDVQRALGAERSVAKQVQDVIMQAYLSVPASISGIGDKIMSASFKYLPGMKQYLRVQGAARFSWNPIFRQVRLPMKAEILKQLELGGGFPTIPGTNWFLKLIFPKTYKELDNIVNDQNFRRLVPGGLGGEAADATSLDMGRGTKEVAKREQYPRNALYPAAGLVRSTAERMGLTTEQFLEQHPDDAHNAITSLLHYDPKNGFLNSPMAKTLNIAFFPFRFNVKVTTYMAKFLARQTPIMQYATVVGIMNAHKFLNSPQGMAWYSNHSDAIGLFEYISPLETISTLANVFGLKHDSVAQYGELGGLPFGWIPLMLDSVGLTHFGQAYVHPKTGEFAKDYIPTSMYGAVNSAMMDFLSSVFSYPGAVVGLPSKTKIVHGVVSQLLPGSGADFEVVSPTNITPGEAKFARVVQGLNSQVNLTKAQVDALPKRPVSSPITVDNPAQTPDAQIGLQNIQPQHDVRSIKKTKKQFDPGLSESQRTLLGL